MKLKVDLGIKINKCSECEKYNKGVEIHKMFDWGTCNIDKVITFDKKNDEIVVFEEWLMYLIKMVNPMQSDKRIRIEKLKDYYSKVK